jgi:hypothetical protein
MTGDSREEDNRSPTETFMVVTRATFSGVPNVAGWSSTGNLSGLGGFGIGAIEWISTAVGQVGVAAETAEISKPQQPIEQQALQQSAEAPRSPQILTAEARLSGKGGFPIAEDKIAQLMATGAILAAAGGFLIDGDKIDRFVMRPRKDNSDIGKGPGRPSAKAFVLPRAEEELKADYSGTKRALAEKLSIEVKQQYKNTDELTMCVDNVEGWITPVWRRFRGDAAR